MGQGNQGRRHKRQLGFTHFDADWRLQPHENWSSSECGSAGHSQGLIEADTLDTVRLSVADAAAIGERALQRGAYSGEDAEGVVKQKHAI